jgi:hypothetical protein
MNRQSPWSRERSRHMTKAVSGDALTALVARWRERRLREGCPWRVSDTLADCADELEALIAAGRGSATPALRCDVTYANWNQCVRPHGHSEPHLTDNGFNWMPTSAPAPLPAPQGPEQRYTCGHEAPRGEHVPKFCPICRLEGRPPSMTGELASAPAPLPAPTAAEEPR